MSERWLDIEGYEGLYQVSDSGRVRRISGRNGIGSKSRIMKNYCGAQKYACVWLYRNGVRKPVFVHLLVMRDFVGPVAKGIEVDHLDFDRMNSSLPNLEYVTKRENLRRRDAAGRSPKGERNGFSKFTENDIVAIRKWHSCGMSYSEIRKEINISLANLSRVVNRKAWTHV